MKIQLSDLLSYKVFRGMTPIGSVVDLCLDLRSLEVASLIYEGAEDRRVAGAIATTRVDSVDPLRRIILLDDAQDDGIHTRIEGGRFDGMVEAVRNRYRDLTGQARTVSQHTAAVMNAPRSLDEFVSGARLLPFRSVVRRPVANKEAQVARLNDVLVETVTWRSLAGVLVHGPALRQQKTLIGCTTGIRWDNKSLQWLTEVSTRGLESMGRFDPAQAASERVIVCKSDYNGNPIL